LAVILAAIAFGCTKSPSGGEQAATTGSSARTAENEAAAVGALAQINSAERSYAETYRKGFSPTLGALGESSGSQTPSASAADLITGSLATGTYEGYTFSYRAADANPNGVIGSYTVSARPAQGGKGAKRFFTDETGAIRWTGEEREAVVTDPQIPSQR